MKFTLRDYQKKARKQTYGYIKSGYKKIINWINMGGGKGLLMADYAHDALKINKKVLVVMRRRDLIFQTKENFKKYRDIKTSIIMGKEKGYDSSNPVQICSIDTIRNKIKKDEYSYLAQFDLILIDECHDTTSASYEKLFDFLGDKIFIGFTATPFAIGNKPLLFWEVISKPINPSELMEQGYLAPCEFYRPNIINTAGIKKIGGDYAVSELFDLVNDLKVIGDAVDSYKKYGNNKPFVGFCVNINHSKIMAKAFCDAGINAIHIDQSHNKQERENAKKDILSGKIKGVFNVNIFATGWDCPPIEVLIGLRPTLSEILALQQWGRILRMSPETGKKNAIVLDHANNSSRHGFPYDDNRMPCITHFQFDYKKKEERKDEIKVKDCPECGLTIEYALKECWGCGFRFVASLKNQEVKHEDGELVKVSQCEDAVDKVFIKIEKYFKSLIDSEKKYGSKLIAKYFKLYEKYGNQIFSYMDEFNVPKWFEASVKKNALLKKCFNCKKFRPSSGFKYDSRFLDYKSSVKSHDIGYCIKIDNDVKKNYFCINFKRK